MNATRWMVMTACVGIAACGRPSEPPARPAVSPEASAADAPPAAPTEVRIEEGMLRDLRITTASVESRRGDEQVTLLGELAVDEGSYAEIGVPVTARVTRLLAGVGDRVRDGQAVLELQSPEVGTARSTYLSASARLTLAERALTRKRELAAERIAPQREVQEAEADAAAAQADLRAATAALRTLGLDPPREDAPDAAGSQVFVLRTPVSGTVIERAARRGQMLNPETTALRIADLSSLWLTVHAFERDAVRIQPGTTAQVAFSALPGRPFTGRVTLVGRQVSSESRTVDVRIEVRNPDGVLRPGMAASAALPVTTGTAQILAVPVAAVQRVGGSWCVFLPRSRGLFEIRPIGRGRDLGTEVEVLSGLAAGDVIVVNGAFLLRSQAEQRDAGHDEH
jgi:cobalt-zinc-cadmium efflux system membrane fusion protein